jgi:hypothetical protein
VTRGGGSTGAVSVQLDVLNATASANDANLTSSTLNWAAGDTVPKTATLNLTSDAQTENLELLLVRLRNPQGGATVTTPDATSVTIADAGATSRLSLLYTAPVIDEARGKAYVGITRAGSAAGEARLSYRTLAGGTYTGVTATQGEFVWPDGDSTAKLATVTLNPPTLSAGQTGNFQVEFFNPVNATLQNTSGASVAVLPLSVTVNDTATPPAPTPPVPPPSSSGGGGGGAVSLFVLSLLGSLLAMRSANRRRYA